MARSVLLYATVYYYGQRAGLLEETPSGFSFFYFRTYLDSPQALEIDLELPLQTAIFKSKKLFGVFENLLPQGYARRRLAAKARCDIDDQMELLLYYCWPLNAPIALWPMGDKYRNTKRHYRTINIEETQQPEESTTTQPAHPLDPTCCHTTHRPVETPPHYTTDPLTLHPGEPNDLPTPSSFHLESPSNQYTTPPEQTTDSPLTHPSPSPGETPQAPLNLTPSPTPEDTPLTVAPQSDTPPLAPNPTLDTPTQNQEPNNPQDTPSHTPAPPAVANPPDDIPHPLSTNQIPTPPIPPQPNPITVSGPRPDDNQYPDLSHCCPCCFKHLSTQKELENGYHDQCLMRLFATDKPITIDPTVLTNALIVDPNDDDREPPEEIAWHQPVVRLRRRKDGDQERLVECNDCLWEFELKLPSERYDHIVELEATATQMAQAAGLNCLNGGRIRLPNGQFGYIWRRAMIDPMGIPLHRINLGNLNGKHWQNRHAQGLEIDAKHILRRTANPKIALSIFFTTLILALLFGCNSLNHYSFTLTGSPIYSYMLEEPASLIPTALIFPAREAKLGIPLDGNKNLINAQSFANSMLQCGFKNPEILSLLSRFQRPSFATLRVLAAAPLPKGIKRRWLKLIIKNANALAIHTLYRQSEQTTTKVYPEVKKFMNPRPLKRYVQFKFVRHSRFKHTLTERKF